MVASKKTIKEVMCILERWRKKYKIRRPAITDLLLHLSEVRGNKSFKNTLTIMKENWIDWKD